MLVLRNWLEFGGDAKRVVVIGVGLAVWIIASAVISAFWLRRVPRP
jgi:hypothetical protein